MRTHKNRMHLNKGYSLVEMIIVIAIIAILSVLSLVTFRAVEQAKYQKAVTILESEMTNLRTTTMAQDSTIAFLLYRESETDGPYLVKRGYCDNSGTFHAVSDQSGEALPSDKLDLAYYDYEGVSSPVKVLDRGYITFQKDGESTRTYVGATGVVLQFNKSDGSIASGAKGAGEYTIYNRAGQSVTTIRLKKDTGLYVEVYDPLMYTPSGS